MTTPGQTRAIHAMRKAGQIDNREYRALLDQRFGKASSADLTDAEAGLLIEELRRITGVQPIAGRKVSATASGKYAPVLRALWISAWHLGLARSRDDAALIAFVQRQTRLAHLRFLAEPSDAAKAIEGLKAWIARDGGVQWPEESDAREAGRDLSWLRKKAVARAAVAKLSASGDPAIGGWEEAEIAGRQRGLPHAFRDYGEWHWDRLIEFLGGRIRDPKTKRKAA